MKKASLYENARRYYAIWAGVDPYELEEQGVTVAVSELRDEKTEGYSKPIPMYCLVRPESVHVCVGQKLVRRREESLNQLKESLHSLKNIPALDGVLNAIRAAGFAVGSVAKKYFLDSTDGAAYSGDVEALGDEHYDEYLSLFKAVWPDADPTGWLSDYYHSRLVENSLVWGIRENGILVSASDAGSVPYLSDVIIEPGIKTHPQYRRRGYAKVVCASFLRAALDRELVPIWSCSSSNIASDRLAKSLGFSEFGKAISVREI